MEEYDYHINKRPGRTYFSPMIKTNDLIGRSIRLVSKVIDPVESHQFVKIKDQLVIKVTQGERQELKASIYQDSREIEYLIIQKFSKVNGNPLKTSVSFGAHEISVLEKFLSSFKDLPLDSAEKGQVSDLELNEIVLTQSQKRDIIIENLDLVSDIVNNDLTKSEIIALGYRKKQLEVFSNLLTDPIFFEDFKNRFKIDKEESVWQKFFEKNVWIFGYGLNFILTSNIEDKKLEQVVSGYDFNSSGKRVDALMKTRGFISALCFVEIKKPTTLLIQNSYRTDCWPISTELAGAIAQLQKTVQKSVESLKTKTELKDKLGNPTGKDLFLYKPKSYVIAGNLSEFGTVNGINEEKYSSFEIFRNSLNQPEIITFDELYERAKFIVKSAE